MAMKTRYAQVAHVLADKIASGTYPVGSVLPTEVELAEQLGVSRATVRIALSELQQLGLISRRRNAGTRVEAMRPVSDTTSFFQLSLRGIEDLLQYSENMTRDVQEITDVVADDELAEILRCRPGKRWLRVSSLRRSVGKPSTQPVCWTDIYIDGSLSEDMRRRVASYRGAMASLVEERTGRPIVEIVQNLRAIEMPESIAARLQSQAGAPALEIVRFYFDKSGATPVVSISIHPTDRFTYTVRLKRLSGRDTGSGGEGD